jgi:hypothetical protein
MPDSVAPESIPFTYEFVADVAYQRSLSRAVFARTFWRPWWWILFAVFLLLLEGTAFSTLPWQIPVSWIVLVVVLIGFAFLQIRRRVVATFPVGKVLRSGFAAEHFAVTDGDNTSVLAYSGFDAIDVYPDVVWLRRTNPKRRGAFPRTLFPDAEVQRMRAAFAKPAAASSADSPRPTPGTPA